MWVEGVFSQPPSSHASEVAAVSAGSVVDRADGSRGLLFALARGPCALPRANVTRLAADVQTDCSTCSMVSLAHSSAVCRSARFALRCGAQAARRRDGAGWLAHSASSSAEAGARACPLGARSSSW